MSTLLLGTNVVAFDEPAYSLKELNGPASDSRSVRRYQCIRVLRNDRVVEYRRDLGPAADFLANEFAIPGGVFDPVSGRGEILHTVGELVDIADLLRSDHYAPPEMPKPSDLVGSYLDLPSQAALARRKRSMVGPVATIQRS